MKETTKTDGKLMHFPKEYKQDFSSETVEFLFVWNYTIRGINCSTNVANVQQIYTETILMVLVEIEFHIF